MAQPDPEKASQALWDILQHLDWNNAQLAAKSGLTRGHISNILGNPRKGKPFKKEIARESAVLLCQTFERELDRLPESLYVSFCKAVGLNKNISRGKFLKQTAGVGVAIASTSNSALSHKPSTPKITLELGDLSVENILNLVKIGVERDHASRSDEAAKILMNLVNPYAGGILNGLSGIKRNHEIQVATAVAKAHLGHAFMNVDDFDGAKRALEQVIDFFEEILKGSDIPKVRYALQQWNEITGRAGDEYYIWSRQMLGLVYRHGGGQRFVLARRHLITTTQIAKQLKGIRPSIIANLLRDIVAAELHINTKSELIGKSIDESINILKDSTEHQALALSQFKRAEWHKLVGNTKGMENDIKDGLITLDEGEKNGPSLVFGRIAGYIEIADMIAAIDPTNARFYAEEARKRAQSHGHSIQSRRAERILSKLD